jgi:hypothetical protein
MRYASLIVVGTLIACRQNSVADGPGQQIVGKPVETRPANAKTQEPAFPGQTRAPYVTANVRYEPRVIA